MPSGQTSSPRTRQFTPPKSPLAAFFWRKRLWVENTFALSMMENWEKLILVVLFAMMTILVTVALVSYLPHHLSLMRQRMSFYISGQESPLAGVSDTSLKSDAAWASSRADGEL